MRFLSRSEPREAKLDERDWTNMTSTVESGHQLSHIGNAAADPILVLDLHPGFAQPTMLAGRRQTISHRAWAWSTLGFFVFAFLLGSFTFVPLAFAQGGPPYYTTDPGTPGNMNWEINFGYMPFLYNGNSLTHTPDIDINFGVGDRIQLTYENAWLRVWNQGAPAKYGMGQDNVGVKWRFYDSGEEGMQFSIFPQGFINNPNHAVQRGITPPGSSFLFPVEFTRKIGPIDLNLETGYSIVHLGPNSWFTGAVVGHEFKKKLSKLELDAEFFSTGTFHPVFAQPTLDIGGRYKLHRPFILLWMAGRGLEPAKSNQPYFVGYFGVQVLLPLKSYPNDESRVPEDAPGLP